MAQIPLPSHFVSLIPPYTFAAFYTRLNGLYARDYTNHSLKQTWMFRKVWLYPRPDYYINSLLVHFTFQTSPSTLSFAPLFLESQCYIKDTYVLHEYMEPNYYNAKITHRETGIVFETSEFPTNESWSSAALPLQNAYALLDIATKNPAPPALI